MQDYFLLIPLLVIGITPLYLYYKDKNSGVMPITSKGINKK